jgi:hypothetical protein
LKRENALSADAEKEQKDLDKTVDERPAPKLPGKSAAVKATKTVEGRPVPKQADRSTAALPKTVDERPVPGSTKAPKTSESTTAPEVSEVSEELESGGQGTRPEEKPRLKPVQAAFVAVVMLLFLLPLVGMTRAPTESTSENRELAELPGFFNADGSLNFEYADELGDWFSDHFAYRSHMVTADALLKANIFSTSATEEVVLGSDGWLFYNGTINDYVSAAPLSDRQLWIIAHNLSMMQEYAEKQGAEFVFTIAPNKNSLYPEHMPGHYIASSAPSNVQRLVPYLQKLGVNYLDLFSLLERTESGGTGVDGLDYWYLQRDSHWNNRSAYIADVAIAKQLGMQPLPATDWETRVDYYGDLDGMLFPGLPTPELQYYLKGINDQPGFSGTAWAYDNEADDVEDTMIQTRGKGEGRLVAYRDSFCNALLPYLASQTSAAEFSRKMPYNPMRIVEFQADFVLVERAERHIDYLARNPMLVPGWQVDIDTRAATMDLPAQARTTCVTTRNEGLLGFSGVVDPRMVQTDSRVYLSVEVERAGNSDAERVTGAPVFEAFLVSPEGEAGDNGYLLYLPYMLFTGSELLIKVYISQGDGLFLVQSSKHTISVDNSAE